MLGEEFSEEQRNALLYVLDMVLQNLGFTWNGVDEYYDAAQLDREPADYIAEMLTRKIPQREA